VTTVSPEQEVVAKRYGTTPDCSPSDSILGIQRGIHPATTRSTVCAIHRRPIHAVGTSGQAAELSADADYFEPLHVGHLSERLFEVIRFLALPPGSRFLIAPDYEDVWFDEALLVAAD